MKDQIQESNILYSVRSRLSSPRGSRTKSLIIATGILFAGPQDLTGEANLDFTRPRQQQQVQRPISKGFLPYPICVLDLETTGFHSSRDSIIEIGIIKIEEVNGELIRLEHDFLVRPPYNIPKRIRELTGITNEMVQDAETVEKVIPKVKEVTQDTPIVAHNAPFDRRMLQAKSQLMGISFAENEWYCTLQMSRRAWPDLPSHKLKDLTPDEVSSESMHRALVDCQVTFDLYLNAVSELGGTFEITPIKPLATDDRSETEKQETSIEYDADLSNEVFVFSGFRDDVLAARLENCGASIKAGISKAVTILLVEDTTRSTGKVKKAKEYGITVKARKEFEEDFYQFQE